MVPAQGLVRLGGLVVRSKRQPRVRQALRLVVVGVSRHVRREPDKVGALVQRHAHRSQRCGDGFGLPRSPLERQAEPEPGRVRQLHVHRHAFQRSSGKQDVLVEVLGNRFAARGRACAALDGPQPALRQHRHLEKLETHAAVRGAPRGCRFDPRGCRFDRRGCRLAGRCF